MRYQLPETGFLRLHQIVGESEVTAEQAEANKLYNAERGDQAKAEGRVDKNGRPIFARRPTIPRPGTAAVIPVSGSVWWEGVKAGRFPAPTKSGGVTLWRVEDIRRCVDELGDPATQLVSAAKSLKAASLRLATTAVPDSIVKAAYDDALTEVRGVAKPPWWRPAKPGVAP